MIKRYTKVFLIFFLISITVPVTGQLNCSATLERAEGLFDQGIIEEIPQILEACMKSGFNPQEKMRAQKLMVLTYLFDNDIDNAERVMLDFLRTNPEYTAKPTDPVEFTALLSGFRTIPVISAGFFIGGNLSLPGILEQYGPYNPNADPAAYMFKPANFQLGASLDIHFGQIFELNLESFYIRNSFTYSNLQYGFAQINIEETHQRFKFPVSFSIILGRSRLSPYLRFGGSYGVLLSASSNYKREFVNTGSAFYSPLETYNVDITDRRKDHSISVTGGAGLRVKIPRGNVFFDIRYFYSLTDLVITENRWENELIYSYFHADSDFMLDYFAFSVGLRYTFYKPEKR